MLELVITIILFVFLYMGIHAISGVIQKRYAEKAWAEFDEKQKCRDQDREEAYISVQPLVEDFYTSISSVWQIPNTRLSANVLRARSDEDLGKLKEILSNEWTSWSDNCECWTKDNTLYILLSRHQAMEIIRNNPYAYSTPEKIATEFPHWAIPFESIDSFQTMGHVSHTEKILGGGDISYIGVTVNGIGFGEVRQDPTITIPEICDNRYIVLHYTNKADGTLQSIYFGYDSLATLIQLIPQYQK